MVPMWTLPIAIAAGNTFILKPSEKVPCTMNRVVQLLKQVMKRCYDNVTAMLCDGNGNVMLCDVMSCQIGIFVDTMI